MTLYFAYGMNTHPAYMKGAREVAPARLRDHVLTFRLYANVERWEGESVEGVLWQIDESTLVELDFREGVHRSFYDRDEMTVEVLDENGERDYVTKAWVYRMRPDALLALDTPSYSYLTTMREGYQAFGLDQGQIDAALATATERRWQTS